MNRHATCAQCAPSAASTHPNKFGPFLDLDWHPRHGVQMCVSGRPVCGSPLAWHTLISSILPSHLPLPPLLVLQVDV